MIFGSSLGVWLVNGELVSYVEVNEGDRVI